MNATRVEESMRLLRRLETLLCEERVALACGEFARAAEATREKEKVIDGLRKLDLAGHEETADDAASFMERLSARQAENVSLLREMVDAVGKELSGLRARRNSLRVYGERPYTGGAAYLNGQA